MCRGSETPLRTSLRAVVTRRAARGEVAITPSNERTAGQGLTPRRLRDLMVTPSGTFRERWSHHIHCMMVSATQAATHQRGNRAHPPGRCCEPITGT